MCPAQAVGGVSGGGRDRFGGRHLHLRGGEGKHHGHGSGGRASGVEIGGQHHRQAGFNHAARRRVALGSQVVDRGGEQHGLHPGGMQGGPRRGRGALQMVGGGGMELGGEQRSVVGSEL